MRILIVHEVSYAKKVVYEYQDFAERLAARGHEVTVVDFDEDGDGRGNRSMASRTGIGSVLLENTAHINLLLVKYFSARNRFKKSLSRKLINKEVDVVLLYSVFINGTNTVRLCNRFNIPVCYRALDVYHKIRNNLLILLPLYFGEKYIYKNCDEVIPTNEKMSHYVKKMSHGRCKKIFMLNHGVDTSLFNKRENDIMLRKKWGFNEDDRIAAFVGTTYDFAGIDVVIRHFDVMRGILPAIKIMIVGGGDYDHELKKIIRERQLEKEVVLTGFQPYGEVPALLGIADVAFNSFQLNRITRDIIPVKIVQYLACGKPAICTPLPDVVKTFPEKESGVLYCDIQNGAAFAGMIAETMANRALLDRLSNNAVRFVAKNFDMNTQIVNLENELIGLCRN
ncbi:MAG: glycosyltransferase [Deltaproteobacteria bacterium]|nr:glycosyltransferase [Deltaproteobacteria bacterium]